MYLKEENQCLISILNIGTLLDIVDTFNYLGIKFCYTGNFQTACKVLAE